MKIKEYDTDELLMIANNVTGEYPEKKVRQAKEELYRRGVDDKVIADIMEEKEEAFMRRLDAAALAEQARLDKEREKNRNVSYRWWELIPMFLFAPFYMSYGMRRLPGIIVLLPVHLLSWTPVDFSDMFRELRRLKEEKYDLKFKQRLTALIAGDLIYFTGVGITLSVPIYNPTRKNCISLIRTYTPFLQYNKTVH